MRGGMHELIAHRDDDVNSLRTTPDRSPPAGRPPSPGRAATGNKRGMPTLQLPFTLATTDAHRALERAQRRGLLGAWRAPGRWAHLERVGLKLFQVQDVVDNHHQLRAGQ